MGMLAPSNNSDSADSALPELLLNDTDGDSSALEWFHKIIAQARKASQAVAQQEEP